ncbi:MAG TPA: hypothetical protein GXZ90_05205 [Clostridiales bacterium]|nr:hypothetical protein [Clostridiales bacterium]
MNNLELIKLMLEEVMKDEPIKYEIEDVWMDYGAGIKHTTIVAYSTQVGSWQIFSPRDKKEIENGNYTLNSFNTLVNKHKRMINKTNIIH